MEGIEEEKEEAEWESYGESSGESGSDEEDDDDIEYLCTAKYLCGHEVECWVPSWEMTDGRETREETRVCAQCDSLGMAVARKAKEEEEESRQREGWGCITM